MVLKLSYDKSLTYPYYSFSKLTRQASLKSTIQEKMVEEMMKEKCGEGDIDAHKSSM